MLPSNEPACDVNNMASPLIHTWMYAEQIVLKLKILNILKSEFSGQFGAVDMA